uniref:3-oxoacyl-[acyl-carrier-protein] synthase n=1 Tax=Plectus sambesii TaxID=2011161 RepID=A0A914VNT3_9BILA
MRRRVVVTGIGLVTPFGVGAQRAWQAILAGSSGIRRLPQKEEFAQIPCQIAGQVPEEGEGCYDWTKFSSSDLRQTSRSVAFALTAAEEAIADSRISLGGEAGHDNVGVAVGMGMADLQDIYNTGKLLSEKRYSKISPYFVPRILTNMAAGRIGMRYGLRGPNHSVSTACTTGAHSVGDATEFIRKGWADAMVCGGTDACVSPISLAGFARLRALSTAFGDEPGKASRPFDKQRDGFVMSEGAAILVLEERELAMGRGARIYAEVIGYGLSGDGGSHMTSPDENGVGAQLCIERAMLDAGVEREQVGYVNAHATSTPLGDRAECLAIQRVFDRPIAVSSTKGHLGHLVGAAGAAEAAVTILSVHHGVITPTLNLEQTDIENRLNLVSKVTDWKDNRRIAICNSFGFGGSNASLCFANH